MKELPLSNGLVTKVDDDVYELVSQWKWSDNGNGYAVRNDRYAPNKSRKQYLHRLITGAQQGDFVDHINGDRTDNRKENLRICTQAENAMNHSGQKKRKYSKYKGVTFDPITKKWVANIGVRYKKIHLGVFKTELEAARAYNEGAVKYCGDFAYLNDLEGEVQQ